MTKRLGAVLVCAFLTLTACGTGEEPALDEPPTPSADAANAAQVTITTPAAGSTVKAGGVTVVVSLENFDVVNKLGQAPMAGEGHVHFYIDVEKIPTTPGKPAITDDPKTYHAEATTTYTWPGVQPGEHTFGVQLVNNDHTPLEPPVTSEVTVNVK